jgi:O-antigen/teichoic acid export membrane protein
MQFSYEKIIKKIIPALFLRGLGAVLGILLSFFMARWLSINDVGIFFTLLTILTIIGMTSTLGFNVGVMKSISEFYAVNDWKNISGVYWFGFFVVSVSSIFWGSVFYTASNFLALFFFGEINSKNYFNYIAVCIPLFALVALTSHALQGIRRFNIALILQRVIFPLTIISAVGLPVCFGIKVSIENALSGILMAVTFNFVIGVTFWLSEKNIHLKKPFKIFPKLINDAKSLFMIMLANLMLSWSGILITSIFFESYQVALFSIAARLSLISTIALEAVNLVVAPLFSDAFKTTRINELRKISLVSVKFLLIASTPILIIFLIFANEILLLFGAEYTEASNLLRILAVGQFFNVITGSVGFLLIMTDCEEKVKKVNVICTILTIIVSVIFAKVFGLYGVAVGCALGLTCQNIFLVIMVKQQLGFNTINIFEKITK